MTHALQNAADRLRRLWEEGGRPDLAEFLVGVGPLPPRDLAAVLCEDQRQRWRLGQQLSAERYLKAYPTVAADEGAALDVIGGEWVLRRQQGEAVDLDRFLARFRRYGDALRSQLELSRTLEGRPAPPPSPQPGGSGPPTDAWTPGGGDAPVEATFQTVLRAAAKADTDPADLDGWATLQKPAGRNDTDPVPPAREAVTAPKSPVEADGPSHGYRLLEILGSGNYGVVHRALSSGGVEVAVKEIRHAIDHAQAQRELKALELIKGLRHPYLLALHDFWIEGDRLYMAMELADGTLAQTAAAAGPKGMYQPEAMHIFEEAAEALDFLHGCHVLHRDIKPANILLLRGHTKVADFGLAKFKPEDVAVSQTVAGTPAYMAPETFRNEFRAESDQYALALCYAEVRLGRQLCEGESLPAAIHWHIYTVPNLEGLADHEQSAVLKALSKEPADRFPSCQEFVRALLPPPALPPAPPRRSGWPAAVGMVACVALLAFVLWRLLPAASPPSTPPAVPTAPTRPPVDWVPEDHGFFKSAEARPVPVGDKQYYDRIARKVGEKEVEFLLIPATKDDPLTFYMMRDKATNGLFKTAANDAAFQEQLSKFRNEYPTLQWDQWHLGGVRNGHDDIGDGDPELPVLRVNVMEAYCFARWLGGNLPTEDEWDRAAGKGPGKKEIYADPETPLRYDRDPPDIAVGRKEKGPLEVGMAPRDRSVFGCRDMAGDGAELTGKLRDGGRIQPGLGLDPDAADPPSVYVRGMSYAREKPEPYHLAPVPPAPDTRPIGVSDPVVGFRVVVEP